MPRHHAVLVTAPARPPRRHEPAPAVVGDTSDNDGGPLIPLVVDVIHRREDDATAIASSPEVSERPDRATIDPPKKP